MNQIQIPFPRRVFFYPVFSRMGITVLIVSLCLHQAGIAQNFVQQSFKKQNPAFMETLRSFGSYPALQGASWGLIVRDLSSGQTMCSHNPNLNLQPASNMKVVTSLNGLKNLGEAFTFKTKLYAGGKVVDGVLRGDLLVEGGGDPTIYTPENEKFGENFFTKVKKLLAAKGISRIEGSIREKAVKNPYAGIRNDWTWSDVGNYYGAGIYPLNINENAYILQVEANSKGKPAVLKKVDSLADVRVEDLSVKTDANGTPDLAYIFWNPGDKSVRMNGSLPEEPGLQKVKGTFMNPSLVFLNVLERELSKSGISVAHQKFSADLELLGLIESPPLKAIVKEVNLFSNNLLTESIAFALAKESSELKEEGWSQLSEIYKSVQSPPGYYFADGCGLSMSNRISPAGLCNLLVWAENQPFYPSFYESLPVSGTSGTMRAFCKSERAKGRIRAKSGTLTRVLCYSGYMDCHSGKKLAFSVMLNSYSGPFKPVKKELEKLLEAMVELK